METKKCPKCKKTKLLKEFGTDKSRHNNVRIYCKECVRKISIEYTKNNKEKRTESSRIYRENHLEETMERCKKYRNKNKKKIKDQMKKKKDEDPRQNYSKGKISTSIRLNKIIRPDKCSNCRIGCKPDGHHPNYDNPLNVIWLCKKCHMRLHARLKRYAAGSECKSIEYHKEQLKYITIDTATT